MTPTSGELTLIARKLMWLSAWMVHNANHLQPKNDAIKIRGHQASCASMVTLMTALYGSILRPKDRVVVKPHAGPMIHAFQHLCGKLNLPWMQNFRGFGGVQSYPSRSKDDDDVDFSTGSVCLGVAVTAFAAILRDPVRAKGWGAVRDGRMVALVGAAELDQSNISECIQKGCKHGLRNCWWVIDYNRQSLDGVVREGLSTRVDRVFRSLGWDVVLLKYGALQKTSFAAFGGDRLNAGSQAAQTAGINGRLTEAHVERLPEGVPRDTLVVTAIDGHPATLSWLGSVHSHRVACRGVEDFGQTGIVTDLHRHFGIDRNSILRAVMDLTMGCPLRAPEWECQ